MKLLVITPTLGKSPWLDETVASVARDARKAIHVLVGPAKSESELERRYPHCKFIAEPNVGGMYAAINAGLVSAATSEWNWFTYLNDDDRLEAGIGEALDLARSMNAANCVVYGDVRYIDAVGRDLGRMPIARASAVSTLLAAGRAPFTQQGTLVSRALWESLGGFDTRWRLAADYDFWCRAAASRARFLRVSVTVASFRLHGAQLSANRAAMMAEIAAIQQLRAPGLRLGVSAAAAWLERARSIPRLWERRRLAGVWTSRALYARFSCRQ